MKGSFLLICLLVLSLLSIHSFAQYDELFSLPVKVDGVPHQVSKLRGFVEYEKEGWFILRSGGKDHRIENPAGLDVPRAVWGDDAVYFFISSEGDKVAVHIDAQHFILLKYLFSLCAGLFVLWTLVRDILVARGGGLDG